VSKNPTVNGSALLEKCENMLHNILSLPPTIITHVLEHDIDGVVKGPAILRTLFNVKERKEGKGLGIKRHTRKRTCKGVGRNRRNEHKTTNLKLHGYHSGDLTSERSRHII
jgi:hypothetical protein